jgi:UDP-glucose 4-epimerase
MELAGRRVVVTGGAGFIGSHVVDRLVAIGADVTVVDDLSVGTRHNLAQATEAGARLVEGDIRDSELMNRELEGAAAVIHMACDNVRASLWRPLHTHDVNSTGTLITGLAAVEHRLERFVYVSSSEAYGSAIRQPMDEDHPLLPTTVYGAAKAGGELNAQALGRTYGLPVTVIRPFNSYGPREHSAGNSGEVIPRFLARIRAGEPPVIFGDGSQTRDFTWVEETAVGIVAASEADALVDQAVNIAHGEPVSIRTIAELLLEVTGSSLEPAFEDARPGDVMHHHAATARARSVLGYEAKVPIREGLERYVRWVDEGGDAEMARAEAEGVGRNW